MATASAKITPLPTPTDTAVVKPRKPRAPRKPPVTATKHDVAAAQERVQKLVDGLNARGVPTGMLLPQLHVIAEASAACRVLVGRGIVTNEEMVSEVAAALEQALAGVLQQVEEQRLRESKGPQLEVARQPLAIARR